MSPETKILLEEFKKEFKSYKDYVDVSPWMDDVNPHTTKGYLYSNKLLTEISLIETIMKSLSKFKEDVGEDYMLKPIQVFIKDAIKIVEMHLKRIDLYKREYPLDESSGESEVKFHSDLFSQKTKTKVSLSKLNITEKETVAKSPELFFGDDNNKGKYVKAPLLMRETLSEVIPVVKTRTDNLNIDFNIPIINPATSNEMLINMKEKDIPKWDPHKHFFEQELSVIQFWQEEINKIKNGINIGGYHIHPWLYWHLNIFKFAWGAGKDKYPKNPAFRDNEYFFTEMLKMAEEDGRKGVLMYGSRRISKSVVMASYLMRTLYTVRNAKCTVLGFTFNPDLKAITDYMQESITNMVPAFKINVNNNDTEKQILLGLKAKNGTDRYDYSTLSITNLEDGSKKGGQKSAGPTPDAWAMDEIAKGDCITVYNAAKPSFAGGENGKWRLIPLLAGTAGEAALSVSAEKMLKNPEGFDLLPMNWDLLEKHVDPDSITWTRDKFPYFVPAQLSLETGDKIKTTLGDFLGEDELSPLQDIYMEKTDWIGAKKFYEEKRLKLENDIQLLASEVNSFPLKVEDCYLSTEKNKFPGLESKRRKDYIEEFGLWGEKGWVEKTYDGFYNFVIDNSKDIIWEYPYKGGNFDAPIVILDDPRPNDIEPPLGLYCIGFDDVKQDTSDGDSVISATIFKRSFEGGEWANRIVGWYDSRPDRKRDYYKNLYLLIKYFNARALHENEDNGFIDFMETNHYDDLYIHMSDGVGLASEENFSKNKNRKWGWSPHGPNVYHLEQKVVAYTKEDGIIIGDEDGLSGIDRINHPMLLYEFYKHKKGQNADRIRSFGLALTLAQYYDKTNQYIKGRKKQIEHDIDTIKKNNVKLSKGLSYTKNLVKY
mgnify:FL=1